MLFFFAISALLVPLEALADSHRCTWSGSANSPISAEAAQAMSSQDYSKFFEIAGEITIGWSKASDSLQTQLEGVFPLPFKSCDLLLEDHSQSYLSRSVFQFEDPDNRLLFLHLVETHGLKGGTSGIISYHITTNFNEIIELWY